MNIASVVQQFQRLDQQISHYHDIVNLIGWDAATTAPKKGMGLMGKARATLYAEMVSIMTSEEMGTCLGILTRPSHYDKLNDLAKACVRERLRDYEKRKRIPLALYKEFADHTSHAQIVWENAQKKNDLSLYLPALEKMILLVRRMAECYQFEGHPYNALLDDFEAGITVERLDPLFAEIKQHSTKWLHGIQKEGEHPDDAMFRQYFDADTQRKFCRYVLQAIGFDWEAGRLDESAHPFEIGINTGDVRITFMIDEHDWRVALFSILHEFGHGLYDQGIHPDYEGTAIRRTASMGFDESQSRLWENAIGRSAAFWSFLYEAVQEFFPESFQDFSMIDFHRALNRIDPSPRRGEADEFTYPLHSLVRYELEKALIEGELEPGKLSKSWDEKMEEYLGVTPVDDRDRFLQENHWSCGEFGYFPIYTVGDIYAAQLFRTMNQQLPQADQLIAKGEFHSIQHWLRTNIHQHGRLYTADELIKRVTGEEMNITYYLEYLQEKYVGFCKLG